jgi:hypothetical protein
MKRMSCLVGLVMSAQTLTQAATLQIEQVNSFVGNSCWYQPSAPAVVTGNFTLPGAAGVGTVQSTVFYALRSPGPFSLGTGPIYTYSLDLSQMSLPANHCVRLAVYFGWPKSLCSGDQVLELTNATSIALFSAEQGLGTINFTFGTAASSCLLPGQTGAAFAMLSDQSPRTNFVWVIDDYYEPASGTTNHNVVKVAAIVPDIPPITVAPAPPFFQGLVKGTSGPATNGQYQIAMQLLDAPSNGVPVSETITSTVNVVDGLFNVPMDFDPSAYFGQRRWLSLSVQPPAPPLSPALPISPTPQAIYAYTAGTVGTISPGQAVTSVNGLTDAVTLQAGSGLTLSTNGNTLTFSALPGGASDRNLKTDSVVINSAEMLARLVALPVHAWRFTNEPPAIRHVGPMAQDFMNAFHLGNDDRLIGYLDEGGVALAAIQGLNQKVEAGGQRSEVRSRILEERLQQKETEITELKQTVNELKNLVQAMNDKLNGGAQ